MPYYLLAKLVVDHDAVAVDGERNCACRFAGTREKEAVGMVKMARRRRLQHRFCLFASHVLVEKWRVAPGPLRLNVYVYATTKRRNEWANK